MPWWLCVCVDHQHAGGGILILRPAIVPRDRMQLYCRRESALQYFSSAVSRSADALIAIGGRIQALQLPQRQICTFRLCFCYPRLLRNLHKHMRTMDIA
jgi:hypothetical protein